MDSLWKAYLRNPLSRRDSEELETDMKESRAISNLMENFSPI